MTLKSAPYYWIECDAPGCAGRCPPDDSEYTAWGEPDQASEVAFDSEWWVASSGHYCPDHRTSVCESCATFDPTPLAGEREYLCVECFAREAS